MNKFVRCAAVVAALYAPINASADWSIIGLGTLGGVSSSAHGINDSGQIIGSYFINGANKGFVTGQDGIGVEDIGTLGGNSAGISAINNLGQVVGTSRIDDNPDHFHAFLYTNGGMIDLNLLSPIIDAGWTQLIPTAINNNGQIVGYGKLASNPDYLQAFVLSFTPDSIQSTIPAYIPPIPDNVTLVPEPATYAMLLAGLGLLGAVGRSINYIPKDIPI